MLFRIGIEDGDENRLVVWVLGHPGCFAYGTDPEAALAAAPGAIWAYLDWIKSHEGQSWPAPGEIEVRLEETWNVYAIDENYERVDQGYVVNAWFLHDWKPLTAEEVERGLNLLDWSRADLLEIIRDLSPEMFATRFKDERWDIGGIVRHVANAEWWYLDRLGLALSKDELPQDNLERLAKIRSRLEAVLPGLANSTQVVGKDGEFWSPRKLLRRAVWHERDHTAHIQKLLQV